MKKLITFLMMAFAVVAVSCADKTDPNTGGTPTEKPKFKAVDFAALDNITIDADGLADGEVKFVNATTDSDLTGSFGKKRADVEIAFETAIQKIIAADIKLNTYVTVDVVITPTTGDTLSAVKAKATATLTLTDGATMITGQAKPEPTFTFTPNISFTLATIPSPLPTENIWIITDGGSPTKENFDPLEAELLNAQNRNIELVFPNIMEIPANAFYEYDHTIKSIVSVSADKATKIGRDAFYNCSDLTSVDLPKVETLDTQVFWRCSALTDVNLPEATSIGLSAFEFSGLKSIYLPEATSIGMSAFGRCYFLTEVNIPRATELGLAVFAECALDTLIVATKSASLDMHNDAFLEITIGRIAVTTHVNFAAQFIGFKSVNGQ